MKDNYNSSKFNVQMLQVEDVIELHSILTDNYNLLPEMEEISPKGIKNEDMLHSAVSRQFVGSGDYYKYNDPYTNCATLVFGIIKNHSFHNGNKRLGLLCLIKHLYLNNLVIRPGLGNNQVFELLRLLADNSLNEHSRQYYKNFYNRYRKAKWTDETAIDYLAFWLNASTVHKNTSKKNNSIKIQEFRQIIESKGLEFEQNGTRITITKKLEKTILQKIFGVSKSFKKTYNLHTLKDVKLGFCEQIRKDFDLTMLDGVDNVSFYDDNNFLNEQVVLYKRIIYRLAKT